MDQEEATRGAGGTEVLPAVEGFAMRVHGTRPENEEEVNPYIGYCEFCDEANREGDCHGLCGGSPARSDDGHCVAVGDSSGAQGAVIVDDEIIEARGGLG